MSRACCTAIIIFISISFSILLRFWTKEYSNSESNKQTPFSPSFLRPPSAERGEIGGNWLRLWKLVNHDGALPPPPIKIGERAGKLVSREQLFLSDEGNDDGRAGKLRLRRPPPAFRGRKKARGPARERLVNSSRSAPFPYERQPFDKSATKDLWLNTSVSQSGVERTVNAKIQPLRLCLDARPSIIDPASAMGWKSHWRKTVEFLEIPDTDGWKPGISTILYPSEFFFFFHSYLISLPSPFATDDQFSFHLPWFRRLCTYSCTPLGCNLASMNASSIRLPTSPWTPPWKRVHPLDVKLTSNFLMEFRLFFLFFFFF